MSPSDLLILCHGIGVDSMGAAVGMHQRGIRPDFVIHADVGAEKAKINLPGVVATMDYIPILRDWLRKVDWPDLTIVRYEAQDFKYWPEYHTIEENLLTNSTLPSIAYGGHSCSAKWKIQAMNKYFNQHPQLQRWSYGFKAIKVIGFDDGKRDRERAVKGCNTFAIQADEYSKYELRFLLQEWGWDRERCIQEIRGAGLPVPCKSACYFCTASKPWEIDALPEHYLVRIVIIEKRASARNLAAARIRGWPRGVGIPMTEGLWRQAVKGMRGATRKPGSMTEYIREKGLLGSRLIDRLRELTPTEPFTKAEFEELGHTNWQEWIADIVRRAKEAI